MKLDVLEGGVYPVAVSFKQYGEFMNSPQWQEQHLLSQGAALLKERRVFVAQANFSGSSLILHLWEK